MKNTLHTAAAVLFEITVINPDGSIARRLPKKRNLLLNSGLDRLASYTWTELFAAFALGTSSNPTSRDSGLVTVVIAGGTATASAGFFDPADVGRLIKADSGEERTITAYTSPTVVSVVGADVAASQFTVWYVNDTTLGAEVQRFSTTTADTGDHGYNWNAVTSVFTTWVTRVSNAVTAPSQTFKEIGWSEGGAPSVNGRALINGGTGDTLIAGQKYKVKLTLERTVSPTAARACPQITGWPGTAQERLEMVGLSYWTTLGNATDSGCPMEPKNSAQFSLSSTSAALRATLNRPDGAQPDLGELPDGRVACTTAAYTPGSFTKTLTAVWDSGVGTSTAIRSVLYGDNYYSMWFMRMLMSADQVKASSDKLTVSLEKTWGRILVN
jgi:hypothetical protein